MRRTSYTEIEIYFPIGSRTIIYELGLSEVSLVSIVKGTEGHTNSRQSIQSKRLRMPMSIHYHACSIALSQSMESVYFEKRARRVTYQILSQIEQCRLTQSELVKELEEIRNSHQGNQSFSDQPCTSRHHTGDTHTRSSFHSTLLSSSGVA